MLISYLNKIRLRNKYTPSERLVRDFEILDAVLKNEKKLVSLVSLLSNTSIPRFSSCIKVHCVLSDTTLNFNITDKKNVANAISSKKYPNTIRKIIKRNDQDFIYHFIKWKTWQLRDKHSNWKIHINRDKFCTRRFDHPYFFVYKNNLQIQSEISLLGLASKEIIIPSFKIYYKIMTDGFLRDQLFELKIKDREIKDDLFMLFEKILYSDKDIFSDFVNTNT